MYVTLQSSTCFEHQHAHLQEDKLCYNSIWYRHLLKTAVPYAGWEHTLLSSDILYSRLQSVTIPDAVIIQFVLLCRLCNNVEKYCRARQATDDNMAHAYCMLDTYGYKYTLRICNTLCFSPATMVALTGLVVTLYIHCLSCLLQSIQTETRNHRTPLHAVLVIGRSHVTYDMRSNSSLCRVAFHSIRCHPVGTYRKAFRHFSMLHLQSLFWSQYIHID